MNTSSERFAEALFTASVAVNITAGRGDGLEELERLAARLHAHFSARQMQAASGVLEVAYELLCSEIVVEP